MEIIVLKFLATSALLMAFYHFALRKKASYKATRIYLLSLPVASLLMSVLTFEVYTPSQSPVAVLSQSPAPATAPMTMFQAQEMPVEMGPASVSESQTPALSPVEFTPSAIVEDIPFWQNVDWLKLIGLSIPAVSVILLLIAFYYIMKLMVVKSRMKAETTAEGYAIIRSASVQTPFSFAKTIFFPADLDKEKENLIIRHEKAHIAHRHYVDVWVSEFFTRIFWFNPSVWLCRSALRNVHEFEADHDVLSSGANVITYQATLLEMVLNESCPVVSGFNHSFIRSRFIEMRASTAGTLGRFGKIGTLVCLLAMFCVFTFVECSPKDTKNNTLESIQLKEPQKFVIEGTIDPGCTDSCYMITLSDEYLHLADTPSVCIPVVDNKFHYEIDLKHIICGKIQRVLPGGELDKGSIELYFVQGDTLFLSMTRWGFFTVDRVSKGYPSKINRGVEALRNSTNWESPHLPKIEGEVWHNPEQSSDLLRIKDVYFNDDETVVRFASDRHTSEIPLQKQYILKDCKGNTYKFKRAIMANLDAFGHINKETHAFGVYLAFEPMPKGTESFNCLSSDTDVPDINDSLYRFENRNVHKIDVVKHKPNFEITVTASETSQITGLVFYNCDESFISPVADLSFDKKNTIHFSTYLSNEEMWRIEIVNQDGSVSDTHSEIPFIPNEKAVVTYDNNEFQFSGTSFYKEWGKASNYKSRLKRENSKEGMAEYINTHTSEYGAVMYGIMNCQLEEGFFEALPKNIASKSMVGRFSHPDLVEKMLAEIQREKQKNTLPGMMFTDATINIYIYNDKTTVERLSDYVGKGKYVLLHFWKGRQFSQIKEGKEIEELLGKHSDKLMAIGVRTSGLSVENVIEDYKNYARIFNGGYDVVGTYGVVVFPEIILFGPDGTILKRGLTPNDVRDAVEEYIK